MGTLLADINTIFGWLFEPMANALFTALNTLEQIVLGLAGINVDGVTATGGKYDAENVVASLFQSDTTKRLMAAIMLFGICVLFLCVILAIIRNIYKEDSKVTISSIIGQAIRAVIGFILVPALCLVGVMFSNVILQAIAGATSTGGNPGSSFSSGIYMASAIGEKGNLFYDYTNTATRENLNNIINGFKDKGDSNVDKKDTETSMEFATIMYAQYLYYILTENYYWKDEHHNQSTHGYVVSTTYRLELCSRNKNGIEKKPGDYLDVLGLKVPTDNCLYLTPEILKWDNGDGAPSRIDTQEDVKVFYEVLYSQYLKNFPNAIKTRLSVTTQGSGVEGDMLSYEELLKLTNESDKYPKLSILLEHWGAYFGCSPKINYSFIYYYYGERVFVVDDSLIPKPEGSEYTVNERGYRLLKGAYNALCNSGYFTSNDKNNNMRFDFEKTDNSLTNKRMQATLGIGSEINWFYAFLGSILVFKSLFYLSFGLAKRLVQLVVYYILSPIALALYPFDNGKAFASWKSDFVGYTIGAYGAVAGMNLSVQLTSIIINIQIFQNALLNGFVRLIMYIVLAQGMEALVKTLSGWIGAKDLLAEGKETSKKATEPIKKVAGTAMKVAGTAVGVATGIGIAKAGSKAAAATRASFKSYSAEKQAEEAQKAGYSSVGEYEAALDKEVQSGTFRGQFKSAGGKMLTGATNKMMSTTFGQAFDKYSGFSGVMAQNAKSEAKSKTKSDLEKKFQDDFNAGLVTADLGKNMQSKLEALKEASANANKEWFEAGKNLIAALNKHSKRLNDLGIRASEYIRTGDPNIIKGLTNKQQALARAEREEYLRSDAYQNYAAAKANRTSAQKAKEQYEISGEKGGTVDMKIAIPKIVATLGDKYYSNYVDAQKLGDTDGMRREIEQAMKDAGLTGGRGAMNDIINGINAEIQKANDKIKKTVEDSVAKAEKKAEKNYKPTPPKK